MLQGLLGKPRHMLPPKGLLPPWDAGCRWDHQGVGQKGRSHSIHSASVFDPRPRAWPWPRCQVMGRGRQRLPSPSLMRDKVPKS